MDEAAANSEASPVGEGTSDSCAQLLDPKVSSRNTLGSSFTGGMSSSSGMVSILGSEIVPHPSFTPFYTCSVPGNMNLDIMEIKAVLNYGNILYAVVVTKSSEVMLWQTHLPLNDSHTVWSIAAIMDGPTPRLDIDFLCVLHGQEIWLVPVNQPKVAFVFTFGKGEWTKRTLTGSSFAKVTRAASLRPSAAAATPSLPMSPDQSSATNSTPTLKYTTSSRGPTPVSSPSDKTAPRRMSDVSMTELSSLSQSRASAGTGVVGLPCDSGIYLASDTQHGILDPYTCVVTLFEHPPTTQMDDVFVVGDTIYGGDNGSLYIFQANGLWRKIMDAPKATFWALKGSQIYCFIKAKQHGKPLQIGLSYHTETKVTTLLDCRFVIPGETPFPYEIPSPVISHGPFFYFFTEELRIIYAFDVFSFCPYQPIHSLWSGFVNSPKFADVLFSVNGKTFHGHKVILSSHEYFSKLFAFSDQQQRMSSGPEFASSVLSPSIMSSPDGSISPVSESFGPPSSQQPQVVTVTDMSAEAFTHLLQFLYTGQLTRRGLNISTSCLIELLFAGNKYMLNALTYKCSEALISSLDVFGLTDLLMIIEAAYTVDENGPLFKKGLECLFEKYPTFIAQPEFIALSSRSMELYRKVLRVATQFVTVDRAKLATKANCCLTLD